MQPAQQNVMKSKLESKFSSTLLSLTKFSFYTEPVPLNNKQAVNIIRRDNAVRKDENLMDAEEELSKVNTIIRKTEQMKSPVVKQPILATQV